MAVLWLLIRPQSSSFTHSSSLNEERPADCCTLRRPKHAIQSPIGTNARLLSMFTLSCKWQSIYEIVQLSCVSNLTEILQSLGQLENTSNSLYAGPSSCLQGSSVKCELNSWQQHRGSKNEMEPFFWASISYSGRFRSRYWAHLTDVTFTLRDPDYN